MDVVLHTGRVVQSAGQQLFRFELVKHSVTVSFWDIFKIDGMNLPTYEVRVAFWMTLRAASRGKAVVVPGGLNQATALSNRFVPRFVTRKIAGAMFKNVGNNIE